MKQKRRSLWCCPACGSTNGQYQSICEECNWLPANHKRLLVSWRLLPTAVRVAMARKRALSDANAVGKLFLTAESTIGTPSVETTSAARAVGSNASKYAEVRFHKFQSWEKVSKPRLEANPSPNGALNPINRTPAATLKPLQRLDERHAEGSPQPAKSDVVEPRDSLVFQSVKGSTPRKTPAKVYELNHETFEWYCAEWCVYLGQTGVEVTRATKDGGIDVRGVGFVAQVKFQDIPVGVRAVRELSGVAFSRKGKLAFFFCINGYSAAAVAEAEELGVALFVVKPSSSKIEAVSSLARLVLEDAQLR